MKRVLIIPAAGRGSRLDAAIPKLLFPVNGRRMIDFLFDLYAPVVDGFILVVHPSFEGAVRRHCAGWPFPVEYALQGTPTGMLDAILIPREGIRRAGARSVWITWCDQIAVRSETVGRLAELSARHRDAALIFPTVLRAKPYTHLVRDERGGIVGIRHRREGDTLPEVAESDMGLFSLSRECYLDLLSEFSRELEKGAVTRERNFLPFIPWLHGRTKVRTFPGHHEMESVGINTLEELGQVESYLRDEGKRAVSHYSGL